MTRSKFIPKDGQVDYTNVRYCPVMNAVVMFKDKVLLVKRSDELWLYPGYWNGISGFLDDNQSIEEKATEELLDELGIAKKHTQSLKRGCPLIQEAPEYAKTWLVIPVLATVTTDKVALNWEAEKARWFEPKDVPSVDLLPGFIEVLRQFL